MPRVQYRYTDSSLVFEGQVERSYVTRADIVRFLERDAADLDNVKSIRFKTKEADPLQLLTDDAFVRIEDTLTLLLVRGK